MCSRRIRSPRSDTPSSPATATTSPGRAPERKTAEWPANSPSTVTDRHNCGAVDRSPPSTPQPSAISSRPSEIPRAMPSRSSMGVSGGHARATITPVGVAPIAATSARLLAIAFHPTSCGFDQSSRKSGPSIIMSQVVTTTRPSMVDTAESSPGGTTVECERGSRGRMRARVPRSPSSRTVTALPPVWPICPR